MLFEAGVRQLRYSAPWHRIERVQGVFDFTWFDKPMRYMRTHGMHPVIDPIHHISFPDWLEGGFANPEFPDLYCRFVTALAERYPWIESWTVFNEPLPTTLFCSFTGGWYPYQASDECFVRMAINVARAMACVSQELRVRNPRVQLIHMDTCEAHRALDARSENWVRFANGRRFLMHDLLLGRVDRHHPLYSYLRGHGVTDQDLSWLSDHGQSFDVLGLDYYIHSEIEWYWDSSLNRANISWPVRRPAGFAPVAAEYARRFRTPVMLGETNLRGTVEDRITWLRFMELECERLAYDVDFRGFCWYPSLDTTDWCNFCKEASGQVDPQGIWSLGDDRQERHETELTHLFRDLTQGRIAPAELPAYEFSAELARDVSGYRRLMNGWTNWRQQPTSMPEAA